MISLQGKVAVVTGGTKGVGRGIAAELAAQGAQVFVTGRSIREGPHDETKIVGIRCDHRDDREVVNAFERVARESSAIDIVVNNVWGGYEQMMEGGVFTWSKPFWEQPIWRWDAMFAAGVRAHYFASQLAARSMVARKSGLIVNLSFWSAQKRIGNVAYGVSKAATDKMTADMADELRPYGVAAVSLYPRDGQDRKGDGSFGVAGSQQLGIPGICWTRNQRACRRSRRNETHGKSTCGGSVRN